MLQAWVSPSVQTQLAHGPQASEPSEVGVV